MSEINSDLRDCIPFPIRLVIGDYLHAGQALLCPDFFPQRFWREADVADYIIEEMDQGWRWIESYRNSLVDLKTVALGELYISLPGKWDDPVTAVASARKDEKSFDSPPGAGGGGGALIPQERHGFKVSSSVLAPWECDVISRSSGRLRKERFCIGRSLSAVSQNALFIAAREKGLIRILVKLNDMFSSFEDDLIAAITIEDAREERWYDMPPFNGTTLSQLSHSISMLKFVAGIGSDNGVDWVNVIPQLSRRCMAEFGRYLKERGGPAGQELRRKLVEAAGQHCVKAEASFILRNLALRPTDEEIVEYELMEELRAERSKLLEDGKRLTALALKVLRKRSETGEREETDGFDEFLESLVLTLPPGSQKGGLEKEEREFRGACTSETILCPLHVALLRVAGIPLGNVVLEHVVVWGSLAGGCGMAILRASEAERRRVNEKLLDWSHLAQVRAVLSDGIFACILSDEKIEKAGSETWKAPSGKKRSPRELSLCAEEVVSHLNSFPKPDLSHIGTPGFQKYASDSKVGRSHLFISVMSYPFLSDTDKKKVVDAFIPKYGTSPIEVAINIGAPSIFSAHLRDCRIDALKHLMSSYVVRRGSPPLLSIVVSMIKSLLSDPFYGLGHLLRFLSDSPSLSDMKTVMDAEFSIREQIRNLWTSRGSTPMTQSLASKFSILFSPPTQASCVASLPQPTSVAADSGFGDHCVFLDGYTPSATVDSGFGDHRAFLDGYMPSAATGQTGRIEDRAPPPFSGLMPGGWRTE